jgi:hypothetical protein
MDRQLGILIMKDENDILEEYLTKITHYFDKILVLDGSSDLEGKEICSKFNEVIFYERDKNVISTSNDSTTRGFVWEQAKLLVNDKQWVGILHPDEFPDNNVLQLFEYVDVNHPLSNSICIRNRHFFIHTSQKDTWKFEQGNKIEPKMKYFMAPGFPENRYFRFNKNYVYGKEHSVTVPPQSLPSVFVDNFNHNQYSFRSYEQSLCRAKTRWESGWQRDDYCLVLDKQDIFFDTLKYPEEYRKKYPEQFERCWYNKEWAFVGKID